MHMPDPAWRRSWNLRGQSYVLVKGVDVSEISRLQCCKNNVTSGHVTRPEGVAHDRDKSEQLREGLSKYCHNTAVSYHAYKPALTKIYSRRF